MEPSISIQIDVTSGEGLAWTKRKEHQLSPEKLEDLESGSYRRRISAIVSVKEFASLGSSIAAPI